MKLVVSGKHTDTGEAFRSHISDAFKKLQEKYSVNFIEAHVTLEKDSHHQFRTDIRAHVSEGVIILGHSEDRDPKNSFTLALDHVEQRLKKHRKRLKSHQKQNHSKLEAMKGRSYILGDHTQDIEHEDEEAAPVIIAEMLTHIPHLSVSEAVMQLDLEGSSALVFYNKAHGSLNFVFRRPDNNISWIDPHPLEG